MLVIIVLILSTVSLCPAKNKFEILEYTISKENLEELPFQDLLLYLFVE